jgi:hypothetical protein
MPRPDCRIRAPQPRRPAHQAPENAPLPRSAASNVGTHRHYLARNAAPRQAHDPQTPRQGWAVRSHRPNDIAAHYFLTPFAEKATEEDRPTEEDAAEATRGAIALVDGTLWPCWSWDGESNLWAGKYKTTGHGSLIVTNLQGRITFVSEPVTGNQHDMRKLKGSAVERILEKAGGMFGDKGFIGTDYITTPIRKPTCRELFQWEHEWNNQVSSYRAPVERAVATLKTWRILFTDYRLPLKTFKSSFRAATGLYFFKESFA